MDYFNYRRRKSSEVLIGNTPLGGKNPIRIQSMTNTNTLDTEGSIEQSIRIIDAGAHYVRLTAQGVREAENLANIKKGLHLMGYQTPLIADIHFNPKAADAAAKVVEKVRINPGNFVDSARTFKNLAHTDEEYLAEIEKIRDRFIPFLDICRKHHTAIRIGVNHGSLSDRIMSRYGDTPEGMAESCLEFLRICQNENFTNVVISIKASNPSIMVRTVRLLISAMEKEKMHYPLHLGVTEAGDGEDGRIKSAVGIGTLLADGIGDTIRVSLSESPEAEIPVAQKLAHYISTREGHTAIKAEISSKNDYYYPEKRAVRAVGNIGGKNVPVVICELDTSDALPSIMPDYIYIGNSSVKTIPEGTKIIQNADVWNIALTDSAPLFHADQTDRLLACKAPVKFLSLKYTDLNCQLLEVLNQDKNTVVILYSRHKNLVGEQRAFFHYLLNHNCDVPVILQNEYDENLPEDLQLKAGADFGALLLDYFGEGVMLKNSGNLPQSIISGCLYAILQATRQRISKTEYISCPSCGRTLFDLQSAIARIKEATSHLTGLKIGIMGCIVNGPGEMADADYGYVGAGRDRISLYKGKVCVEKNIREELAVDKLVELIKQNGDWKTKE